MLQHCQKEPGKRLSQTYLPFSKFGKEWGFAHITSSSTYPQSNGEVERAVQTAKKIAKKPEDPYLAFLSHRSTPPENGYTPTELLLMGRKIRSTLSMSPEKLIPKLPNLKRLQKTERKPDNYKLITTTYVIERQSSLT